MYFRTGGRGGQVVVDGGGVAGWGLGERAAPAPARAQPGCPRQYARARSFRELIALVRAAEARLVACGHRSVESRIHVLRGLYYGTEWSTDYKKETSLVRNVGFQVYTASATPADPRRCLDCGLFEALRQSQDVSDRGRSLDFGHLMIGLDARRSRIARAVPIPSQGGPGLAIVTWLGDLGGGATTLARRRVTAPTTSALTVFRGDDFGATSNLEGDAAGYLVARDPAAGGGPSPLLFAPGQTVADALEAYLGSAGPTPAWSTRCRAFLDALGGTIDAGGAFRNRAILITRLAEQIEAFGCWYLINRLRQKEKLTIAGLRAAVSHLRGASREVAQVFVDALDRCRQRPGSALAAQPPAPAPSPPGQPSGPCAAALRALEASERAREEGARALERGREALQRGREVLEQEWRRRRAF
jgi:hypothetical protein